MKKTGLKLQIIQDENIFLTIEKIIRGGISSEKVYKYFKSDEETIGIYIHVNNLSGWVTSQPVPQKDNRFANAVNQKNETDDYAETGYFVDVDLKKPVETKEKNKDFTFCPQNKNKQDNLTECILPVQPKDCIAHNKLICVWSYMFR